MTTARELANLLVAKGIVQPQAVSDPVDYDNGVTAAAIARVSDALNGASTTGSSQSPASERRLSDVIHRVTAWVPPPIGITDAEWISRIVAENAAMRNRIRLLERDVAEWAAHATRAPKACEVAKT